MIGIVDYGSGNIRAIRNIYDTLNVRTKVISNPKDFDCVEKLVLPGVGSFDQAMASLNSSGIRERLDEAVLSDLTPVLGICVGMQIMANTSEEGMESGLGWIDATVREFEDRLIPHKPKKPHMGWNSLVCSDDNFLLSNIDFESGFYFVHSYYFSCENESDSIGKSNYGIDFTCAVNNKNIYGVQFHPEKSHLNGVKLFENFSRL